MKKREIGISIVLFVVLGLILLVILGFSILLIEILNKLVPSFFLTAFLYVILGASIGISLGFGYIISKHLFDALLNK